MTHSYHRLRDRAKIKTDPPPSAGDLWGRQYNSNTTKIIQYNRPISIKLLNY